MTQAPQIVELSTGLPGQNELRPNRAAAGASWSSAEPLVCRSSVASETVIQSNRIRPDCKR